MNKLPRIFVTGCPRTGTTFMRKIIGAHPDVFEVPEETNLFLHGTLGRLVRNEDTDSFFNYFWSNCYKRVHPWSEWSGGVHHFMDRESAKKALDWMYIHQGVGAVRTFVDMLLLEAEDTWVEKTPLHCLHMDDLRQVFPDCIIIYMERNLENIKASLVEQDWFPNADPETFSKDIIEKAEEQIAKVGNIIRIDLDSFLEDPVPYIDEMADYGLPAVGTDLMFKEFDKVADKNIAARISNSDRRVN